ncbi:MAG: glycosyltransferase family 2 protein [Acidimicrobiales bacterium]
MTTTGDTEGEPGRDTVSVVIPAFNESGAISDLSLEVIRVLEDIDAEPEIVVVDDGSTDDTSGVVMALRSTDPRVHLVRLSRNFGHQAALAAGLRQATGDAVVSMDGDGQHPPATVATMVQAWRAGSEVVNTRRIDSDDAGFLKRRSARIFYRLFRWLSGLQLEDGMADFRLMSRPALEAALASMRTRPFIRGVAVWIGFEQSVVSYRAQDRRSGASSFSPRAMFALARDGIVGFSARPLWIISTLGFAASMVAFAIASYAIIVGLVSDQAVPGWASTVGFISILQGLGFILLGVIGVYLGAIFSEVLDRPTYIVSTVDGDDPVDRPGARPSRLGSDP